MLKKREIDSSTLYSFDGPFQLIHADVGNLELLGKSATAPRYVEVNRPLFSRNKILQKMKQFYEDIKIKRNMKRQCVFK